MQTLRLSELLQKKFVGTEDLRRELTEILKKLPEEREIIITQSGKPKAVIVDIASYIEKEELTEQIADQDPRLIKRINKIIENYRSGREKGTPAEEVFKDLGI